MEYLLGSGNILNMFETQKYWNKISQKVGYLHSKIHCLTLDLLCTTVSRTIFFLGFISPLKLVYFSDSLDFKYAHLRLWIRLDFYGLFKDIYPSEQNL